MLEQNEPDIITFRYVRESATTYFFEVPDYARHLFEDKTEVILKNIQVIY